MQKYYDAIVIGSGFGGAMAAHKLVNAGMNVLMLERGSWVTRGPENWGLRGSVDLGPHYDKDSALRVVAGGNKKEMGLYSCVGGPSVFYGGVSFRFREQDFEDNPEIAGGAGAQWPIRYADLEPYYTESEHLLNIAGETGADPTAPYRSAGFPQAPAPLAAISSRIKTAAERMGLHPFSLPMAIQYTPGESRNTCISCTTCDTFACAIGAKNDLATVLLPRLIEKGLTLLPEMVVTRLEVTGGRVDKVHCVAKSNGERLSFSSRYVVLAAGALGSPHLLLSSGLEQHNPGGKVIGRYLMRHANAIVFGIFPGVADRQSRFHKQIAILDYYLGHPDFSELNGKVGSLQQVPTPPMGLVQNEIPGPLGKVLSQGVRLLTGLLAIAEDQPQFGNGMTIDNSRKDRFGLPQPVISHHYSQRDLKAVNALIGSARKIMRHTGALTNYVHHIRTFSHTVGTVRMGLDPATSALDEHCQFRGLSNLFVTDGSFMPTSAALNPSLTIAANALRVGDHIAARGI
jgi:choline dehydrogenase-like flavoprotein